MVQIYLGTQGWSYKDWVGSLYPPDARPSQFLHFYAGEFDAVELDTTFYAIPRPAQVDSWRAATPDGFQFTAKTPKSITHDRHLVDADGDMAAFLQVITRLDDKLGAVLLQMPPDFTFAEVGALESFLGHLPDDVRFAVEFRHRSWLRDETYEMLHEHGTAFTMIDLRYMPRVPEITADFVYVRWLGDRRQISHMDVTQIDRRPELDQWADVLEDASARAQRIYGFANNHYSGHSPADIRYLHQRLGIRGSEGPRQGALL
jgi:uncharacterized protein YecE (DUF72 family)